MVPVAADGIHRQEHKQEEDDGGCHNATFGHAAAHLDEKQADARIKMTYFKSKNV